MKALSRLAEIENDPIKKQKALRSGGQVLYKIFRTVLLFTLCFVVLYPLIYMISVSFRETADLYDPTVIWIPKNFTLENYKFAAETMDYFPLLLSTLTISVVSTLLSVASCSMAGYAFARFKFKGKGLLFACVLFTIIVPPQLITIPLYLQYNRFDFFGIGALIGLITGETASVNLLNSMLTMFIPAALAVGIKAGLFIYIFRQFFRGMPNELEDAAYIDGCGFFRTFLNIMVPNASGAFVTTVLLSFVWYYNDYFYSSMYFSESVTLSSFISGMKDLLRSTGFDIISDPYSVVTQMQAACMLSIVPLLIIYVFLQRFFTESITSSGIVG